MVDSAISSVLSKLDNLEIEETIFLKGVPGQVESIKGELKAMQGFLSDAEFKQSKGDKSESILVQELRDAAYELENLVEKINWMQRRNNQNKGCLGILSRYKDVSPSDLIFLRKTGKKIEKIQKKISEIFQNKDKYDPTKLGETSTHTNEIDFSTEDDLNMQRLITPYLENKDEVIDYHNIELLDKEKSWEFLRKKVFCFPNNINENTLNKLENTGKELAKKCNGLPLALSVLGGVLSKNVDPDVWSRMIDNFDREETDKEKNIVIILALSFRDLPNHLKSCFLYMACFPEDHLISTSNLIKMWIAEGFIPFKTKYSQEEMGRKYIDELAQRSIIQIVEMSKTHGRIKRIRMHDILRDFCIKESAKIGFFNICNNLGNFEASTSDDMISYRVAFNKLFHKEECVSMPNMRTIIGFDLPKPSLCGLNYLQVLELVGMRDIGKLPDEIGRMIFLKYIGLRKCGLINLPSSIGNLINLQTFDSRDTEISSMPTSFWKISTLRHVYLYLYWICKLKLPNQDELCNVQTLHIKLSYRVTNERKFIRTLHKKSEISSLNLTKLMLPLESITVLSSHGVRELSLSGYYGCIPATSLPNNTLFPPNLRKLKLQFIFLNEDPMPILELLPCLVVLQLGDCTYVGEKMSCSIVGFPRLQHMSLRGIHNVEEWKIEASSMPRLSKLILEFCHRLKMQPEELVHLPTLKELQLIGMPEFLEETCSKLRENGCKVIRNNQ